MSAVWRGGGGGVEWQRVPGLYELMPHSRVDRHAACEENTCDPRSLG